MKGEGNSIDFGERMYDPRIGRWLGVDKLSAKYPGVSPYNYTLNNPILFVDPDGKDVAVSITRNQNGGGTIIFSSTVYVDGANAAERVKAFNEARSSFNGTGTHTDKDGNRWNVKVEMTFKVATSDDVARITNAKAEESGDNLAKTFSGNGRAYAGGAGPKYNKAISNDVVTNGIITARNTPDAGTGNILYLASSDKGRTAIHENLHLLGLGDRYSDVSYEFKFGESILSTAPTGVDHEGFKGDIMAGGWNFNQVHVDNLAAKALKVSQTKGDNFIMGCEVDKAKNSDAKAVPQKWSSGTTEYTNPTYKKVP